jgi:hypothetical protein
VAETSFGTHTNFGTAATNAAAATTTDTGVRNRTCSAACRAGRARRRAWECQRRDLLQLVRKREGRQCAIDPPLRLDGATSRLLHELRRSVCGRRVELCLMWNAVHKSFALTVSTAA